MAAKRKRKTNTKRIKTEPEISHAEPGKIVATASDGAIMSYYEKANGNWLLAVTMFIDDSRLNRHLKTSLKGSVIIAVIALLACLLVWPIFL